MGQYVDFTDLPKETQNLLSDSVRARDMAYCPYSKFQVGAALLTTSGVVYSGCNIENAAHSPAICAERTALSKAISEGERKFKAIAVSAYLEGDKIVSPCGVCRQVLFEFAGDDDFPVYLVKPDLKRVFVTSVKDLLPYGFRF